MARMLPASWFSAKTASRGWRRSPTVRPPPPRPIRDDGRPAAGGGIRVTGSGFGMTGWGRAHAVGMAGPGGGAELRTAGPAQPGV